MFCEKRQCRYSLHCSSIVLFWWATLSLFFKFWTVATIPNGTIATVAIVFYFLVFRVYFFFLLYILLYWYNKFHNIFTIIEMSISCCCFSVLALFIYSAILVSHFVFFFFPKFWTVATVPSGTIATIVTIFFFQSSVCTFFFPFIYIVILTQQIS